MTTTAYDPDPKVDQLVRDAIARLDEHVRHRLGSDPGCGQWCATCEERIMAHEMFVDVIDRGWYRHVRFGNDPESLEPWPPPRTRPAPPPLRSLGRVPRAER